MARQMLLVHFFACLFCLSNVQAYTPALKGHHFTRMPEPPTANVTKTFAKAGIISGTTWDLFALAAAHGALITEYMGIIYLGSVAYPASSADTPLYGDDNGFSGTVDGVQGTIHFVQTLPRPALFSDPWHLQARCTYSQRAIDEFLCLWPEEPFIEVDPNGEMRVWAIRRNSAEPVLLAIAAIITFARLLPHSRQTTTRGKAPATLPSSVNAHLLADVTATSWWLFVYNVAAQGPAALLHPSTTAIIPARLTGYCGVLVFCALSVNASIVLLVSLRFEASDKLLPLYRAAYETILLATIIYSIPASVAPLFHILLQFGAGATIIFVIARDTVLASANGFAMAVLAVANTVLAAVYMLPLLVESDAMPATTEIPLLLCVLVQFAVAGSTLLANNKEKDA
mgnify:CR=1 FL=1